MHEVGGASGQRLDYGDGGPDRKTEGFRVECGEISIECE